jgi:hypothetical protein
MDPRRLINVPYFAIVLFVLLYVAAALVYPGGSDHDRSQQGFHVLYNYWCDLMNAFAKNNEPNPSRNIAIAAMIVLFSGLVVFWHLVPVLFQPRRRRDSLIRIAGSVSMITAIFLFTSFHDLVINIAGATGVLAFVLTFTALYRSGQRKLFYFGVFALGLCIVNYIVYYSLFLIVLLPVLQKLSFVCCLAWIVWMNSRIKKRLASSS